MIEKQYIPDHMFGTPGKCTYCGFPADQTDHVIPISFYQVAERQSYENFGLRTYACRTCNSVLYDRVFADFYERMEYIQGYYDRKFIAAWKAEPKETWTEEQLAELDYNLQTFVRGKQGEDKKKKKQGITKYQDPRKNWMKSVKCLRMMRQLCTIPMLDPKSDRFIPWLHNYFSHWLA